MINNAFDDHIKKSFGEYEPEVPAHIWENIVAGKEKRRPVGILFSVAGNRMAFIVLFLILSTAGAVLVHSIDGKSEEKKQWATAETLQDKTTQPGITAQENSMVAQNQPTTSSDQTANTSNSISTTSSVDNNKNPEDFTVAAKQKVSKKNKQSSGTAEHQASTTNGTRQLTEKHAAATFIAVTENGGLETMASAGSSTIFGNNQASLEKYYLNLNSSQPDGPSAFTVKDLNLPALNIPCPSGEKDAAANKRYFEIYGGPDYVFRTFADTANSTYLQKRKESTSFSSAFSVGFRYTKVFNNAMNFRTGLNYSQVNEKFKYEQGQIVQLVYNIDANGDTTGSYATTGTRYKTTHNRYKTIDIPLLIGYEMGNGKFHTNINAGLVVNVYSWQKGDVLDNSYQPVNITTGQQASPYQFKANIGVGFMGGVSFYYKLNDRLHILGEPYFRYNFSAVNKSEITLRQKYTTTGLRLGLRYDF